MAGQGSHLQLCSEPPLPLQTMSRRPFRVTVFLLGAEATTCPFPYVQKPHGSEALCATPSPPQPTMIGLGALPGPLLGSQFLAATVASGRGDRKQSSSARRRHDCQASLELRSSSLHRGPAVRTLGLRCQPRSLGAAPGKGYRQPPQQGRASQERAHKVLPCLRATSLLH